MFRCYYCKTDREIGYYLDTKKRPGIKVCRDCNTRRKQKYRLSPEGRRKVSEASKRAHKNHPEKWRARSQARRAVAKGILIKPKNCQDCCKSKPLQGHHEDYSKPLEVIWLCSSCHANADSLLESKKNLLTSKKKPE